MPSSRRDFLQLSATAAAAALTLGVDAPAAGAVTAPRGDGPASRIPDKMIRAQPVPLGNVRLTGGPLKHAQELDAKYLLSLDPDRMLAYYRIRAGLPKKAEPYGGWDGGGRNLTGHIAGHHLSAVSYMYLATGDARFKARADYLVAGFKEVQDANGNGYLCALENGRKAFGELSKGIIHSAPFDLNGLWSPWYTVHKTFAGLRDAYRHTGNRTALEIATKFAAWADGILAPLNAAQLAEMLNTEQGGMNEVLADLYADTGDERWLRLSYKFEHHAFTDALKRGQDNLNGKHANCQIPKLVGSAARYGYTADAGDLLAAGFFWETVVQHHTYASGGHGLEEYFGPADGWTKRINGRTCESCNVYNMLKLTRQMFALRPDPFYADFQERALFNHQLSSIDPTDGDMSYMVPIGRGEQQEYQDMYHDFTCCVGTGMENHALAGYGIYYETPDTLYVNVFAPSTVHFPGAGVDLAMDTDFPDGEHAKLTLTMPKAKAFTLAVRRPSWAGDGFRVRVNGRDVPQPALADLQPGRAGGRIVSQDPRVLPPSTFVELTRTWKSGDTVELQLPKTLRFETTPDDPGITAIMWGPLALAADLGPRRQGRNAYVRPPVPVLVAAGRPVAAWIAPDATPGNFTARQVARIPEAPAPTADLSLKPFYRTFERTYSVYFDVVTPEGFDARVAAIAAAKKHAQAVDAATVAMARPGNHGDETQYHYQSDPPQRRPRRAEGRSARGGPGWFSLDMPVDSAAPMALLVTFLNQQGLPPAAGDFRVLVDGTPVATFAPNADAVGFWDARYDLPASLTQGKKSVTVRFEAVADGYIAPVYGVRTIRADQVPDAK